MEWIQRGCEGAKKRRRGCIKCREDGEDGDAEHGTGGEREMVVRGAEGRMGDAGRGG